MTISATERRELRGLALRAFGERGADLLMAGLASADPEGMEERLKLRIELSRAETKTDLSGLRGEFAELKGEFAELKGEFGELKGEFGELRGEFGELRGEFGELRGYVGEQVGGIRAELANQTRVLYFALVATIVAVTGLVYNAYQAGH